MTQLPAAPLAQDAPPVVDADWWRQAAIYQIYPRSFADGNGDGIGDLEGVLAHVDYLASLGIDAVWFSPFYPSALADGGYDIDDYRDIDPLIGTLEQFDQVLAALGQHDIKVIVDIVPNHSSDRHVWFTDALATGRGSAERDRYIFRDGRGDHGELPPSDWQSLFGGPAWTRVADGQWYLHLFTPQQPDWNWDNREVRDDFLTTLRFWGDRGVAGFRVDVAMALAKDMSEPLDSWAEVSTGLSMVATAEAPASYPDGQNPIFDRDEVHEIYAEWRTVFNSYSPPLFAVAEAWVEPRRRVLYSSAEGLGQAFNFDLLTAPWDAAAFTASIRHNLELATEGGTSSTWVFSNHDVVRHATRLALPADAPTALGGLPGLPIGFDAGETGRTRALAATALAFALPGSAYVYQGEELGLPEVSDLPPDRWQDPAARIVDGTVINRDGCRVPLPWTQDPPFFGFSASAAHLPQPDWFGAFSVEVEDGNDTSALQLYRRALALRRTLRTGEQVDWLDLGPDVVAFRRPNGWTSVTNFGAAPISLPEGDIALATQPLAGRSLPADTTAWLVPAGEAQ